MYRRAHTAFGRGTNGHYTLLMSSQKSTKEYMCAMQQATKRLNNRASLLTNIIVIMVSSTFDLINAISGIITLFSLVTNRLQLTFILIG